MWCYILHIKKIERFKKIKDRIKQQKPDTCSFRLWRMYIQHVGL